MGDVKVIASEIEEKAMNKIGGDYGKPLNVPLGFTEPEDRGSFLDPRSITSSNKQYFLGKFITKENLSC